LSSRKAVAHLPCNIEELDTPALVVDLDLLEQNIHLMARHFAGIRSKLRPHFKTHKCPQIAQMQMGAGALGITCAKLGEAEVLCGSGIRDILIANQVVGRPKIERLCTLTRQADLKVAVDDPANVDELSRISSGQPTSLGVLVELDVGMNRCGVKTKQDALRLAERVINSPGLDFRGLMGYEGHVVLDPDQEKRRVGCLESLSRLTDAVGHLRSHGAQVEIVSAGGTGTYAYASTYPGITEVQAGSYVMMDTRYSTLGLPFCSSLFLLTSVVSTNRDGGCVTDAGLKTLATEFGMPQVKDRAGLTITALSEEHGLLRASENKPALGERLMIVPSHCCTTVNLHDALYGFRGDTVEVAWDIAARGRSD